MYDNFDIHAAAESIPLTVFDATEEHAAARITARHARDKDDLAELLAALALPDDADTLTALLPLIPDPADDSPAEPEPTGDEPAMPDQTPAAPAVGLNAFEAMALSMHNAGDDAPTITEATGMSQQEVEDLLAAHTDTGDTTDTDTAGGETAEPAEAEVDASTPAATEPDVADVDLLLMWAQQHPLASVRATAGRIRQDLADLNQRRVNEQVATKVEARIAELRAELKAEEDRLRQLKVGVPRAAGAIETPTPIRPQPARRSDLAAIRTWARENGHQVGVAGVIKASIVAAYDAAHQQPATLAKAG
ncbi:Lsr2 family DNA-binding protein [Actinacidiphila yeochonensis]|uniref:Lsr2 family DNA-binding protein n=1 Tax=Actinacidiphila yeochonensis TaxID=89050 RepID=UPI00055B68AF|nr:histone-like nucleoid-structuring protein Lsr2 [Actinacidiphila yeochonensis]